MEVKPGFKQADGEVIPIDWNLVPLESVTPPNVKNGIVDGPFGSNLKTIHYRNSGIPIITSGYVTDGRFNAEDYLYVDQAKFNEEKRSAVKPGDIVMAKIGERCGASAMLPVTHEIGILSGNALKITIDSQRHSAFYIWQVLWNLYSSGGVELLKTVGAQPAISMANLKKYKVPVPPTKAEQEAIAEALSDADALIESLEQLLAKKRQLKQGAMQELLTGKRRLPGFSGEWESKPLAKVAPLQRGFDLPNPQLRLGLYPVVYSNGILNYHTAFQVRGPGVVTGRSGTIGTVTFVEQDFWPHNTSLWVTSFKDNDPRFVYYLLNRIGLERFATGSGVPTLNRNDVHSFKVSIPPRIEEQVTIAAVLSDMDAEIAALEAKLAKARQLKQGMMQELLTGKTRLVESGKLIVENEGKELGAESG